MKNPRQQPNVCPHSSFSLLPSAFSSATACSLVLAARRAYGQEAEIEITDAGTDTRVILLEDEADIIVAFRGTQDLRNWLTDLDCRRITLDGLKIHDGFEFALNSVLGQIRESVCGTDKRIWLTGHSLGGALAMLCGYHLQHECNLSGVYTFGQPRVGNRAFGAAYDRALKTRTFRVIHADDIIPRIPWLPAAYCHAGTEVFYPSGGATLQRSRDPAEAAPCLFDPPWYRKLPSDLRGLAREARHGKLALLEDHHVNYYVDLLLRA